MSTQEKQKKQSVTGPLIRRYMSREIGWLSFGILAGIIGGAAAGFGIPAMMKVVFPIVFGEEPAPVWLTEWLSQWTTEENMELAIMWAAAAVIPLIMFIRGMATYANNYMLARAGMNALRNLQTDVFTRLQSLSFAYLDRKQRGTLMTIVVQYTQGVQHQMVVVLNDLVIQPLTLLASIAYLVYAAVTSNSTAALLGNLIVCMACVPLVRFIGKHMVKSLSKAMQNMTTITATVEEALSSQREVRAFNLETRQEDILNKRIRMFNHFIIRMNAWRQALHPAIEIVCACALSYSLYRSCGDGLTLSEFSAVAAAFYFCYDPGKKLGTVMNTIKVMETYIIGINEILEAKDDTPEPENPTPLPQPAKGAVKFEHVSFSYNEDTPVLRDISLEVPAGQTIALVGPSGSGKTTFINLICRFYDVDSGTVSIDGIDVRQLSRADRTAAIALVSQFAALFNASILDNIRVGRPDATEEEVKAAGASARVDEFVDSHPDGYNRVLSEGGAGLSGGQRQRVAIARAFLKHAPILILDEATSALDMKSEAAIQAELDELAKGRTTFVIAHRFSTIRMAQRILVFDQGRILADGSHEELYESCAVYRSLYDEQMKQNDKEVEA